MQRTGFPLPHPVAAASLIFLLAVSVVAYTSAAGRGMTTRLLRQIGSLQEGLLGAAAAGLGDSLPPVQELEVAPSSHRCLEAAGPVDRVCNFQSLVLYNGTLYYIADGPNAAQPPLVDVHYVDLSKRGAQEDMASLWGPGRGLEVVQGGEVPWGALSAGTVQGRVLGNVYLWSALMGSNLGHGLGEEFISLHNSMCKYLGSCTYAQRRDQHIVLLPRSRVMQPVNDTVAQCMSRGPLLTTTQWSELAPGGPQGGVVLLRNVTVGIGPDCRSMGDCRPKDPDEKRPTKRAQRMAPDKVASWRQRIGECMGFDPDAVASLRPVRVLVLDRTYESGRSFTNIRSIRAKLEEMLPGAEVEVVYMEGLPIREQILAVSRASLLFMMHGAALGFWPFLPKNAVAVHVVPHPGSDSVQAWGERMAEMLREPANVSYVPLTNQRPELLRYKLDKLQRTPGYWRLEPEVRLQLLEEGKCPHDLMGVCLMRFMRQSVDLELDLEQLQVAVRQAVRDLLAKFPPQQTAHLVGWPT